MTYRKYYMGFSKPIIRPLKSKTAEIRHLENGDDFIFMLCMMKIHRLVKNDMATAVI